MTRNVAYGAAELRPYVNWVYFFHAWGFAPRFAGIATVHDCPVCRLAWVERFDGPDSEAAREAVRLYGDADAQLRQWGAEEAVLGRFGLYAARSEGDDIWVRTDGNEEVRLPFLRQQRPGDSCLCWADFIRPAKAGTASAEEGPFPVASTLGIFATAVRPGLERECASDDYRHLLVQTLCDRLAEAAAEKLHEQVRRYYWGYAPDEACSPAELFAEKYQGRRPAVGYPSLPDQSLIFEMDRVLDFAQAGISLTETGMMRPHAAVAGLMFAHPAARHFSIGLVDEKQLEDYARRRGVPVARLRNCLAGNLH